MTNPIAAWHTEHVYFNQLLRMLQREVETFHQGESPNYDLMLDIITYLRDYGDQFHHPREDAAFALLGKRCPDLKPALARLEQEHRVISHAGEALRRLLEALLAGSVVARVEVEIAAATYLVYYGNHIAKEEEDVLPRAALQLAEEDWRAVAGATPAVRDPLFGTEAAERYRELRRRIALEA
jgi:hemerythrin-like domain-containing protein